MCARMETDRKVYEASDLFQQLLSIIDNNQLIFHSLKFFAQDLTTVEICEDVMCILKGLRSKFEDNDVLYPILEFLFKEINLKTHCDCSLLCFNKINEFIPAPATASEALLSPPISTRFQVLPTVPMSPSQYTTTHPIRPAPAPSARLTEQFVYGKLVHQIPIDKLDDFAISGLRMKWIAYNNIIHNKWTAVEQIKAVLSKWQGEGSLDDAPDEMPNFTKAALLRALEEANLHNLKQYVLENC